MAMDVESELKELRRRMDVLESEVDGEKILTRHIFEAFRRNETRLERIEKDMDHVKAALTEVKTDVGQLTSDMRGLRKDLPTIVGDAVRDAIKP